MFSLRYTQDARKSLKKLDRAMQTRIISSLERCRINPKRYVQKLVNCQYYKLRIGDYRVIIDLREQELLVLVIKLGHRKKIYGSI